VFLKLTKKERIEVTKFIFEGQVLKKKGGKNGEREGHCTL